MTTMRLSLHCIYFAGPIRRPLCHIVVPQVAVKDTAYDKPRGVTVFICIHMYFVACGRRQTESA